MRLTRRCGEEPCMAGAWRAPPGPPSEATSARSSDTAAATVVSREKTRLRNLSASSRSSSSAARATPGSAARQLSNTERMLERRSGDRRAAASRRGRNRGMMQSAEKRVGREESERVEVDAPAKRLRVVAMARAARSDASASWASTAVSASSTAAEASAASAAGVPAPGPHTTRTLAAAMARADTVWRFPTTSRGRMPAMRRKATPRVTKQPSARMGSSAEPTLTSATAAAARSDLLASAMAAAWRLSLAWLRTTARCTTELTARAGEMRMRRLSSSTCSAEGLRSAGAAAADWRRSRRSAAPSSLLVGAAEMAGPRLELSSASYMRPRSTWMSSPDWASPASARACARPRRSSSGARFCPCLTTSRHAGCKPPACARRTRLR
mmetsp:Transcript_4052/g.16942  ORF Transcript_4052/g.16942 Transcript_4052/m.16942 type:complete len:383 (-) Transcript_4052:378-1526(-)